MVRDLGILGISRRERVKVQGLPQGHRVQAQAGLVRLPKVALAGVARGLFNLDFLPFVSMQIIPRKPDGVRRFLLTWRRRGNTATR